MSGGQILLQRLPKSGFPCQIKLFNELLSEQHLENYSIRQELFFTSF